jgi:hypothetical protein
MNGSNQLAFFYMEEKGLDLESALLLFSGTYSIITDVPTTEVNKDIKGRK